MGIIGDIFRTINEKKRWMERAAGVSTMRLVCHRDMWAALQDLPSDEIYRPPSEQHRIKAQEEVVVRDKGMLEISLSGPEVVRLIQVTHHNVHRAASEDRAIAERIYRGFGAVLDTVGPHPNSATAIPPIVLDDRPQEEA